MANRLMIWLHKPWMTDLLLFLVSFCIYFFYFPHVFTNFNGLLSSVEGDSIKNYYTFVYHIKNDTGFLNFAGMNYPFGEHVIYTDSHPGLTLLLHYLPFTHNYLIGILHFLIFFSYLIAPLITNRVFMRLGLSSYAGFFISIGLTLLAPQFFRMYAGHFSMAYLFIIPLSALLTLNYFRSQSYKAALSLFGYNLLLFFIHPYLAFGLCVFNLLSMVIFDYTDLKKELLLKTAVAVFIATLLPMLLFKLFLALTDHHLNRPTLPHGFEEGVCTIGSMLVPTVGPFTALLSTLFHTSPGDFEGYCYMGFACIVITVLFILLLPFFYKKISFKKEALVMLAASFVLLLFSFGIHLKLTGFNSETLNQFRALGRFSWFFYYMLPVVIFTCLYHSLKNLFTQRTASRVFAAVSFLFFVLNVAEAGALFNSYNASYFKFRNFFSDAYLNAEEKLVIKKLKADKPQALIPLPTYNIGSEIYDRVLGYDHVSPLLSSFMYSYHTALPIVSIMLSRNSISETEAVIQLINSYKKERAALSLLNGKPFFVIKTKGPFMPDEERILQRTHMFQQSDSLQFGYLPEKAILLPITDEKLITPQHGATMPDSNNVVFIESGDKKPFIRSNSDNYESMFRLDSSRIKSGTYIVSLHYYYTNHSWKDMQCHFLLTKIKNGLSQWEEFQSMRRLSGFYPGYGVFEFNIELERENSYEFFMKNDAAIYYNVSDFMLRPKGTSVQIIKAGRDTVYNNFPAY